ncbi:MAG: DUF2178 domain-containing protein [Halobacterium sp.]
MTGRATSGSSRLAKIRRYRRLMYGSVLGGALGFVVAAELGYHLLGLAAYWVGLLGFVAVYRGTDVELYDERDRSIERRASHLALLVVGAAFVVSMSAFSALEATSGFETPVLYEGALLGFAATMGVFAVTCYWLRCQR